MDQTDKNIIASTVFFMITLTAFAAALKFKSHKLGKKIKLRKEIIDLLQKSKTASTEAESDELLVKALTAWDDLDPKEFNKYFSK